MKSIRHALTNNALYYLKNIRDNVRDYIVQLYNWSEYNIQTLSEWKLKLSDT